MGKSINYFGSMWSLWIVKLPPHSSDHTCRIETFDLCQTQVRMIVKFAVCLGTGKNKLVAVCLFELCYFVYSRLVCTCEKPNCLIIFELILILNDTINIYYKLCWS